MGFIQPCFIKKNTAELRRKLESLGYRKGGYPLPVGREDVYDRDIHLYENSYHFRDSTLYGITNNIDCGTNEDLFIALASMTDDEYGLCDYYIVITDCNPRYAKGSIHRALPLSSVIHPNCYRKATVEELIEHFNKK